MEQNRKFSWEEIFQKIEVQGHQINVWFKMENVRYSWGNNVYLLDTGRWIHWD